MKALIRVGSEPFYWLVEFGRRSRITRDEFYRLAAKEQLRLIYVTAEVADLLPIVEPVYIRYERFCHDGATPAATAERIRFVKEGSREQADRQAVKVGLRVAEVLWHEEYDRAAHRTLVRMTAIAR